jgi:DNA/RNA-binding domain of Phe-tRNA-synthetase-like protein
MKTQLTIESDVLTAFPDTGVAGIAVSNLAAASNSLSPDFLMAEAREQLMARGLKLENVPSDPRVACWRDASKISGLSPSTFRSSVEQLARRILKGSSISTPLPVVTAYCALSAKHLAPMGGYDVERLPSPEIKVRMARPASDRFNPIGGGKNSMPLTNNVVVYASGDNIACWHWNHRDSLDTCLVAQTSNAVFFAEAVGKEFHPIIREAVAELAVLLRKSGARAGDVKFADINERTVTFDTLV